MKEYKEDTLFLAASIADRYLVNLAVRKAQAPCLIRLAIICTLMAAKLEQPIQPSFNRMVKLVAEQWDVHITRQDLLDLEEDIIRTLDFDLRSVSPLLFLERYLRVFQLHNDASDYQSRVIASLSRQFSKSFLRQQAYLSAKPSQVAGAALILSINLSQSEIANQLGLKRFDNLNLNSLYFENLMNIEIDGVKQQVGNRECPLRYWNQHVEKLTYIKSERELRPAYYQLVQIVNENDLGGVLAQDQTMFPMM